MPPKWVLGAGFDGFVNTYGSRFFEAVEYVSDSKQKWRTKAPFEEKRPDRLQVLVHPGLWSPENRPMADVIAGLADERYDRVDRYLGAVRRVSLACCPSRDRSSLG